MRKPRPFWTLAANRLRLTRKALHKGLGGAVALLSRINEKFDLMGWPLFRDQVLPTLPREIQTHIDEEEYLAMKIRLLESVERCLSNRGTVTV
jgi:hypothetical protein